MSALRLFAAVLACAALALGVALPLSAQETATPAPAETPAPPPPDSNKEFIDALVSVYMHNPDISAQREALAATDESVAQAISGFRPNIAAGYSKGRQKIKVANNPSALADKSNKSLTATQDIFNGGETLAEFSASKARVKAARATLANTEQQVLYSAVAAYTDVVEKHSVLTLNQNNIDVLQKQLEATQERFKVGELTQTDVAQAQARLAAAQAQERQALGDWEVSKVSFRRVIGYDAPESLALPPVPGGLPATAEETAKNAQSHPLLENAEFLENAAESDIDQRLGALLPDVSLNATASRSDGGSASGVRRFDNNELTLNVTIPLYQSGAEWSRIRQAKSEARKAKYDRQSVRDGVLENASRSWQDWQTACSVITSNEESVQAAELALAGVKQENEYGERTILDVLNAEQELFTAKVSLVQAQAAQVAQAYRLLAAVGGLNAEGLKLPVDRYDPTAHYDNVKYKLLGF